MRKALIISYDYPPLPTIGALRPSSWYNYFPKNDIYPIVITRKWEQGISNITDYSKNDSGGKNVTKTIDGTIIQLPYKNSLRDRLILTGKFSYIRKGLTLLEKITKWFCFSFDEKRFLYQEAENIIKQEKIDFIIVSGEPFILFRYAHKLSLKHNIPWVADYRDGWYVNHSKKSNLISALLCKYELFFEKKYLKSAFAFSSVSTNLIAKIQSECYHSSGILHPNGIDLELIHKSSAQNQKKKLDFVITYAGSLYDQQNISAFIDGFLSFHKKYQGKNIKLQLIGIDLRPGKYVKEFYKLLQEFPKTISIKTPIPHDKVIDELMSSSILLKFNIAMQSDGLIGGKIYEYIATGKPILTVLNKPENPAIYFPEKKYQNFVSDNVEVEKILSSYYEKYLNNEEISNGITDKEAFKFSRENSINKLTEEIKRKLEQRNKTI